MGQAKQRKAEIDSLKSVKKIVNILAIRHTEHGSREFCHGIVEIKKPVNDKNALLHHICVNNWGHNPPLGHIADYLVQTRTYADMKMFKKQDDVAYVINFYEVDTEISALQGKKTYSCRQIWAMPTEKVKEYALTLAEELKATGAYSVKEHA